MAKQYTLGKNERLKSRKEIEQLFSSGNKLSENPLKIFYLVNGATKPSLRMGVGVSSRNFKKAVERNRIKRQIREAWRLQKINLDEKLEKAGLQLNVFIIYTGREMPGSKEIAGFVRKILHKLETIIGRKT